MDMTSSIERPFSGRVDSPTLCRYAIGMFRSSSLASITPPSHLVSPSSSNERVRDLPEIPSSASSKKSQKNGARLRYESQPLSAPRNNSISTLSYPMKQSKQRCQSPLALIMKSSNPFTRFPANFRHCLDQTTTTNESKFDSHSSRHIHSATSSPCMLRNSTSISVHGISKKNSCQMGVSNSDCILKQVCKVIRQTSDEIGQAISHDVLSEQLKVHAGSVLLLDCRTFVAFHAGHITEALNVSCADAISRKRLACGRVSVWDMVCGGDEAKNKFKKATESGGEGGVRIVLYDDSTAEFDSLTTRHSLRIVYNCLRNVGQKAFYLTGW